ncbi:MAG: hypothetical protein J6R25_00555 [Bacteroidales bacterium]|nr:hypothetical protein [Bacteroidales bacterium]
MSNRVYVRSSEMRKETYLQMPRFYKFCDSYNKVLSSNQILSINNKGMNCNIEECVSRIEQTQAEEITEAQFNAKFQEHLSFLMRLEKGENISDQDDREGWDEIDAESRYSTNERI